MLLETQGNPVIFFVLLKPYMNLVVKNLPDNYNAHFLQMLFEPFGELVHANVLYDRVTREPRGMGFVEFTKEADGEKAMAEMNGKELQGKVLIVEKAKPRKVNIWG